MWVFVERISKYGVVPAHGDDQEATRLGRYSVWTLISRKLSGSRESYEEAKMEYIRMLLSRCSLETSEQVDYYANVPIYYDDRTLISHWYRRWSMGKEAAEEYIRQAHLLGESTTTEEEKNISHDKGDSVSQQLKDEVVTSKEEAVRGTYQEASHTLLEDNKR
ncbi:uncharacterized protein Gasu_33920 [Galdieria sulphuraria]|uniref:Uncharacterized protein n=1 Tax=Galdieria sulphuraria TaxID=130081 RepID=M2WYQ7_GALSU|nr:uncharacterized protein Gasu_33920 [Galdieria sulphuraria]EME29190.1 hypothetical protein Gasu_33920 [Galdieria sulphuraria]|eukprot:XP_005705710.1 hypothetical protein Gasu_33920 [Galdieria sulphuraria]